MRGCLKRNDWHLKFSTHSAKTPYSLFLPHPNNYFLLVWTWLWVLVQSLSIVSSRLAHVRMCGRICFTYRYSIGVIMGLATGLCLLATADNAAVKCVCKRLCESLLSGLTGVYPEAESLPVQLFNVPRNCRGFIALAHTHGSSTWVFIASVLCSFLEEENVIAVPLGSRSMRITVKGPARLCK